MRILWIISGIPCLHLRINYSLILESVKYLMFLKEVSLAYLFGHLFDKFSFFFFSRIVG